MKRIPAVVKLKQKPRQLMAGFSWGDCHFLVRGAAVAAATLSCYVMGDRI
jgi:hypothetical protein